MTEHILKSWPQFFQPIKAGLKTHDLRKKDREFKVGDICNLQEFDPVLGEYTGDECWVKITFITSNEYPCAYSSAYLDRNAIILSLALQES